jgi:VIT1/CCC1 family predicted Fe2+/Mn2+ transporter
MIGVGASSAPKAAVLVAGIAGLVGGAMSMAVGEFVSVSSQRDAERADVKLELAELAARPADELEELASIYVERGLSEALARQVAEQLSASDRIGAHMRDELGIAPSSRAQPLQAAWISAVSFACFALVPVVALLISPKAWGVPTIAALSLLSLGSLGTFGAHLGGAPILPAALRVTVGGALAMATTAAIGHLVGMLAG